jgi:hypothetical protein
MRMIAAAQPATTDAAPAPPVPHAGVKRGGNAFTPILCAKDKASSVMQLTLVRRLAGYFFRETGEL